MILLIISYGTDFTGVRLMKDAQIIASKLLKEKSFIIPKALIKGTLSESNINIEEVDYIVFLGKPLSYFEKLINIHICHFPFSFLRFFSDFKYFFSDKMNIKHTVRKGLNFNKDICYVEPADAIAHQVAKESPLQEMAIIVFLSDCMSSRAGGCYEKKGDRVSLIKELTYPAVLRQKELNELISLENNSFSSNIVLISDCAIEPDLKYALDNKVKNASINTLSYDKIMEYSGKYVLEAVKADRT